MRTIPSRGTAILFSHFSPLKRKQAVSSMMTPQTTEDIHTGILTPVIPSNMEEKEEPHTAAWMPNQPTHEIARMVLMIYFAPFSPRAPPAITAVGSPVSQACMPIKLIKTQMSAYPMIIASAAAPRESPAPSIPPIISAGTQIMAPIHTMVIEPQLCLSSDLISNPVFCFMILSPKIYSSQVAIFNMLLIIIKPFLENIMRRDKDSRLSLSEETMKDERLIPGLFILFRQQVHNSP